MNIIKIRNILKVFIDNRVIRLLVFTRIIRLTFFFYFIGRCCLGEKISNIRHKHLMKLLSKIDVSINAVLHFLVKMCGGLGISQ